MTYNYTSPLTCNTGLLGPSLAEYCSASSDIHHAGTWKMGPCSDPMAVVDPRLRVHGIKGLRVADASIMPQVTSGNTAAPTIMIGDRAAAFIKSDWAYDSQEEE